MAAPVRPATATWRPGTAAQPVGAGSAKTRPFRFGVDEAADPDAPLPEGTIVGGRYRIARLIGEGGMGRVYEAHHLQLSRRVALKLLRPDRNTAEQLARFRQEADATSRVGHPSIVGVFDFDRTERGHVFMAMELLEGEPFDAWLERPGQLRDALRWLAEVARGLHAAHCVGVVHRDVKPSNLYLQRTTDGQIQAKILDFGIAKVSRTDHTQIETQAGTLLGTPYYLAPERALGKTLDARADLYSLGVILYETLTGTVPFIDDSFMGILALHVKVPPLDPRQAAPDRKIPSGIAMLTMSLLAKNPADRPSSGAEVASRIDSLLIVEGEALGAVATGPREQAAPDDATVHLDALADRPTAAPEHSPPETAPEIARSGETERPHAERRPSDTEAFGPMVAFASGAAVRTRFETTFEAPVRKPRRRVGVFLAAAAAGAGVAAAVALWPAGQPEKAPVPIAPTDAGGTNAASGPVGPPPRPVAKPTPPAPDSDKTAAQPPAPTRQPETSPDAETPAVTTAPLTKTRKIHRGKRPRPKAKSAPEPAAPPADPPAAAKPRKPPPSDPKSGIKIPSFKDEFADG